MTSKGLLETDLELEAKLVSRREAIRRGAATSSTVAAGMAMASVPIALAAVAKDVFAQGALPGVIVDVLNFALTLEYLEAEFYTTGMNTPALIRPEWRNQFDQIRKHEVAHVAFLKATLGARAVSKPTFDYTAGNGSRNGPFRDVFTNEQTFTAVAQAFEDTGVRAYKGQAAYLMGNRDILVAALRIHSVEARHAGQIRRLRAQKAWIVGNSPGGLPPNTQPIYDGEANRFHFILAQPASGISMTHSFDEPLTKNQVLAIVNPFIVGGR